MSSVKKHITQKGKPIPKLPSNKFLHENWWAAGPSNFCWTDAEDIKESLIGWCPASRVFSNQRDDNECIAVMFSNNKWCHMSYEMIIDWMEHYDFFDMFNFEGLDRKVVENWAESKREYWRS